MKYLLLLSLFLLVGCMVSTETDYIGEKNKSKFAYKPNKIYTIKQDLHILNADNKKSFPWLNEKIDEYIIFGTLKKGTKLKASRVRRFSFYAIIPFLPLLQNVDNYLEVIDGEYKGIEIVVNNVSVFSDDADALIQKYLDISVNYELFDESDDNEKIQLELNDVRKCKSFELNPWREK